MRYEFGPFQLRPAEGVLLLADRVVPLAPKPLAILRILVERHGHVVLKSELMAAVWAETAVEDANLTVSMSVLRRALDEAQPGSQYIQTLSKRGYRFGANVSEMEDDDDGRPSS